MHPRRTAHHLALLALGLVLASPAAHALRCGNRLVVDGDPDYRVRERCGDPYWSERHTRIEVFGRDGPVELQREVQFDVWYYNFGPRQLLRRLEFRDGRLLHEASLGYGVEEIGGACDANLLVAGLDAGELVARCGEPASRRSLADTVVRRPAPGIEQWQGVQREEWVYDFGDRRLMRILQVVDGRVAGVDLAPR
jgi:hypothetical protein